MFKVNQRVKTSLARGTGKSKYDLLYFMFSINESNKMIRGTCRSFVLCLDYLAISPFIYFKDPK